MFNRKTTLWCCMLVLLPCCSFLCLLGRDEFKRGKQGSGAVVLLKVRGGSLIQRELYLLPFVVSLDVQDVFLGAWMILLLDLNIYKGISTFLWTQHGMVVVLPLPEKPLRRCCACSSDLMAVVLWRELSERLACETLCRKLVKTFLRLRVLLGFVWSGSFVLKPRQNTSIS